MSTPTKAEIQQLKSILDALTEDFRFHDSTKNIIETCKRNGQDTRVQRNELQRANRKLMKIVPQISALKSTIAYLEHQSK